MKWTPELQKKIRKKMRLSQVEFADYTGVSHKTICNIEDPQSTYETKEETKQKIIDFINKGIETDEVINKYIKHKLEL